MGSGALFEKRPKKYDQDLLKQRSFKSQRTSQITLKAPDIVILQLLGCVHRKTAVSYRELEARKKRLNDLEKVYAEMALQKELQKKGKKRKLREDEIVCPTTGPVYKWRTERKR
ncbi:hypothetical protein IFM89_026841 [Coptis chinensis]|uniref:U3 small nucleolar RNA-associated protein 11 n=1 Tax=Coptis chinensis TaxID=261450 RepID=A0A835LXA4_9MAGN|nr:hypothetical protein IFM89_026841 [Coptis chinensis]